ncbi:MAG: hypothetical protein LQ348_005117 [Seirophora lacunosa]|nr:MAG: hypothetical protein LQ344_005622 [Seirophora lacunosa]KAI4180963.1 MAG: hypothetical protein LQ348_005117 [Seirophora lacunosa]
MSQAFKFAFEDENNEDDVPKDDSESIVEDAPVSRLAPTLHELDDILVVLPSNLQYNTIPLNHPDNGTITLPRRELFDIRAQIMAEDTTLDEVGAGHSVDDIKPNIYEGGFKTWECSIDLANHLLSRASAASDASTVVEVHHSLHPFSARADQDLFDQLGAGTAIPTLALFYLLLRSTPPLDPPRRTLVLADYNPSVLHLATIPNLLLTYAMASELIPPASGDLDITPALILSFKQGLAERNIDIRAISGSWGAPLASLIIPGGPASEDVPLDRAWILASETIYSPASTMAFTACLVETMQKFEEPGGRARALVAAKKVYFGVGGGIDEFLGVLRKNGGEGSLVWETEGMGSGVGRCILEVTRRAGR